MKHFSIIILLIGFVFSISSCRNDLIIIPAEEETGEPVEINVLTREMISSSNTVNPDDEINSVRILAFHSGTGFLKFNSGKLDINITPFPLKIKIMTGTYDFVFIANEHSVAADELTLRLDQWNTGSNTVIAGLDNEFFHFNAFSGLKNIPATSIYHNVRVLGNDELIYLDPETNLWTTVSAGTNPIWEVDVERSGIRVDLDLLVEKSVSEDITGIRFANVPDKVPVLGYKVSDNSTIYYESGYSSTYPLSHIPIDEFTKNVASEDSYRYQLERIILPASVFTQPSKSGKGITIEVHLETTPNKPMKAVIGHSIPGDYTSPRNIHYIISGKVENNTIQLDVLPEDWSSRNVSGNSGEKKLNVERLSASVKQSVPIRIHFWSNQPEVTVDEVCYAGNTGNTEHFIDDFFVGLCGNTANNIHYNPSSGSGHMDIELIDDPDLPNIPDVLRICLNASGLKREILLFIDK